MNNLKEIDFEKYITNYLVSENGYILRGADENGVLSIGCGHEPDAPDCFHPPAGYVFGPANLKQLLCPASSPEPVGARRAVPLWLHLSRRGVNLCRAEARCLVVRTVS
jgi:hypothetical protein